ncbi:MAG TPA: hypothetical protein VFJ90_15120, partial [Candidatus Didemnitutus sp.]|nr:hypothetical protein [Candidatus Didemnitutus sp.]
MKAKLCVLLAAVLGIFCPSLLAGNLKVNLTPSQAVSAGAQWRVDGGAWRSSGTTVSGLSNGTHSVSFKAVTGWIAPSTTNVTVTSGTTTVSYAYVQASSLKITLTPSTGKWRVDGGTWQNSAATVANLAPGAHTVDYQALAGYAAPNSESITLTSGQTTSLSRSYTQLSSLQITLTPSTGNWRVDGGAWQNSAATAANLTPGVHTVDYQALTGYIAPPSESVTLASGQLTSLNRSYTQLASLTITLTPATAQWRIDGGGWLSSGAAATNLLPGSHTIDYAPVSGYTAPAPESVALGAGQSLSLTRAYVQLAQLQITLSPSGGQWRVDGGVWQASGALVGNLSPGDHPVDYAALANYSAPASEVVTLAPGQTASLSRTYTPLPGSLTVSLTPATGQWQVDGGGWHASDATVAGLASGNHAVTYLALPSYDSPPNETVQIFPGSTATLARSYTAQATLTVHASPTSATRVGAAKWRIDGGAWRAAETSASVSAGTHSVEFQAVAGWLVPDAMSVTLGGGQPAEITGNYYPVHRLRFFLHQNLVGSLAPAELQYRIAQYAAHIQTLFHRETVRRLTFDPANDITICTASPFSNGYSGTLPEIGFEAWLYVQLTDNPSVGTYGGNGGLDQSGAGGGTNLMWDTIYDPSVLQDDTPQLRQYWTQIDHATHELEHTFGAGLGEYYSPGILTDPTTVDPIAPTTSFVQPDPTDHF